MSKTKVTYIISDIDRALAFEWIACGLNAEELDLRFVLFNRQHSHLESFLLEKGVPVKMITIGGSLRLVFAFSQLLIHLLRFRPHVVHCHLRTAELLGITTSFLLGIPKRIYTRHSATYNHLYHPKGVWVDKLINRMATDIVAVSKNVADILAEKESVPVRKIHNIHHGFDFAHFKSEPSDKLRNRSRYNIPSVRKVIGLVARYTWWKGFAYSIPAIGSFMKERPGHFLVLANARGNNVHEIRALIKAHLNEEDYLEIDFEPDLGCLYSLFDIHIHVPFDSSVEAFGQTYVEALISGIPSIFTLSGVAPEFVRHEYNALVVDFRNSEQIEKALCRFADEPELRQKLVENGYKSVEGFKLVFFVQKLERIYRR